MPTLVIHGSDDILFPISCGKEPASGMPGAKLFTLEGGAHSVYLEMADKIIPGIMGFLAGVDAKSR